MSQEEKTPESHEQSDIKKPIVKTSDNETGFDSESGGSKQKKKDDESTSKEAVELCFSDDPEDKIVSDADEERDSGSKVGTFGKARSPSIISPASQPQSSSPSSKPRESKRKTFSILRFFRKKEKHGPQQNVPPLQNEHVQQLRTSSAGGSEKPGHDPSPSRKREGPPAAPKRSTGAGGSSSSSSSIKIMSASELPRDIRSILKGSDLTDEDMEKYLPVILNILTFTTHKYWKTSVPNPYDSQSIYKIEYVPNTEIKSETHFANLAIPEGSKDPFKIIQRAGKGGFGTVFQARYKEGSDQKLAIKKLAHVKDRDRARNMRECGILNWANHPNVVKYIDAFTIKEELWLIMEFLEGVSLNSLISGFSFAEKQIALVMFEVIKGVDYLHKNNLIHRDIKSSNIMVCSNGVIKLVDFGLCNHVSVGARKKIVGSPYWIAPEMLRKQVYGFPVDIWSLGIVQIEMENRRPPNREPKLKALFKCGLKGVPVFPLEDAKRWSDTFNDFLNGCITAEPTKRRTAAELLEHAFLQHVTRSESLERYVQTIFMLDLKL